MQKEDKVCNITPANRVGSVQEYYFSRKLKEVAEMNAAGKNVINLGIGSPDLPPSEQTIETLCEHARKPNEHGYQPYVGIPELRKGFADWYKTWYNVDLDPKTEIQPLIGSKEGILHISLAFLNPGDGVLVPNPGYPMFEMSGILAKANVEYYTIEEENGYLPDLDSIPEEVLKKTKYMIVSYPLNPVCVCAPDEFYEKLIAFAKKNEIVILHDNAYSDITYGDKPGKSFLSFEGAKDVGVEFYSLSKSYNLTGARISFVVGNKEIISKFRLLRSQIDYGIFYPVQYAAIAALIGPDDFIEEQRRQYASRNKTLCGGLRRIGWDVRDSQGRMFDWAKIPEGYASSVDFCMKLMERTGVIVTPGSAFGSNGEGYVRMALVVNESVIEEIVDVLDASGIFKKNSIKESDI